MMWYIRAFYESLEMEEKTYLLRGEKEVLEECACAKAE